MQERAREAALLTTEERSLLNMLVIAVSAHETRLPISLKWPLSAFLGPWIGDLGAPELSMVPGTSLVLNKICCVISKYLL